METNKKVELHKEELGTSLVIFDRLLEETKKEGLTPGVVMWALMAMKDNNSLSPAEAIQIGYNEWIK